MIEKKKKWQGVEERVTAKGVKQYRATAYDRVARKPMRGPWTGSLAAARGWRIDTLAGLQNGTVSADRGMLVSAAINEFLDGIESGAIRSGSGKLYKPSTIAGYQRDLRGRVMFAFGDRYLREVTLPDLQLWADKLAGDGLSPSTVRNALTTLRAVYGWALPRGHATINPTRGLRLPSGEEARDRVADREEAAQLVAALEPVDRAILGLAVYAGLRLGEILALDWANVDLDHGTLRVVRAWDPHAHVYGLPKSKAGIRTVPISQRLRSLLLDHRVLTDHRDGLLFVGRDGRPPVPNTLRRRMRAAWADAGLAEIGFHEARHSFASAAISAGLNAKTLATAMGHASIAITYDRYGHLFPGSESEAAALLDAYLSGGPGA